MDFVTQRRMWEQEQLRSGPDCASDEEREGQERGIIMSTDMSQQYDSMNICATQSTARCGGLEDNNENDIDLLVAEEEEELNNLVALHYFAEETQQQCPPSILPEPRNDRRGFFEESTSAYGSDDDEFDDIFRGLQEPGAHQIDDVIVEDAMDTSGS